MKNSRATLVNGIRKRFGGFNDVESYIVDLTVYTKNEYTHLQVLDKVLCRLQQAHLAFRPTKFLFCSKFVKFLGHFAGGNRITIKEENLKKIRLTTHHEKRTSWTTVLGTCNFCRNLFPTFAAIAAPLSHLPRKELPKRMRWEDPLKKAFVALRENLQCRSELQLLTTLNYFFHTLTLCTVDWVLP